MEGALLGHLRAEGKRLILHVGNHNITGTFKDLGKTLHVVQRKEGGGSGSGSSGSGSGIGGGEEYTVKCIVRRKLVFTERPHPVISAALAKPTVGKK